MARGSSSLSSGRTEGGLSVSRPPLTMVSSHHVTTGSQAPWALPQRTWLHKRTPPGAHSSALLQNAFVPRAFPSNADLKHSRVSFDSCGDTS
jgi:hypothetical protein